MNNLLGAEGLTKEVHNMYHLKILNALVLSVMNTCTYRCHMPSCTACPSLSCVHVVLCLMPNVLLSVAAQLWQKWQVCCLGLTCGN